MHSFPFLEATVVNFAQSLIGVYVKVWHQPLTHVWIGFDFIASTDLWPSSSRISNVANIYFQPHELRSRQITVIVNTFPIFEHIHIKVSTSGLD